MTVWCVFKQVDYFGDDLICIFKTEQQAEDYIGFFHKSSLFVKEMEVL